MDKAQLTVFETQSAAEKEVLDLIAQTDFDNLSPRQAFDLLWTLKNRLSAP